MTEAVHPSPPEPRARPRPRALGDGEGVVIVSRDVTGHAALEEDPAQPEERANGPEPGAGQDVEAPAERLTTVLYIEDKRSASCSV